LSVVPASYFDGRSTRVHPVSLSLMGDELVISGADIDRRVPFAGVKVDERLGGAPRRLRLPDGSFCEVRDRAALDTLLSFSSHREGRVDRMQRRLPFVLASLAACVLLTWVAYQIALPWAAEVGARRLPAAIGKILSVQTLKTLDAAILQPSSINLERQKTLTDKLHRLRLPDGGHPYTVLLFRKSPQLGANAFTLPDGTLVVLDDLIDSAGDDAHVLAVLAHELGHAHGRHGLQLLLRTSAVGAFWSFYIGDVSQLLAAAPAAVVEARYSQELEREADDYAASLLLQSGMSPELLADVLAKLTAAHPGSQGGYLSSHPPTAERLEHLRSLARRTQI
jgi:Zn-dependent protease with chaperone function